MTSTEVAAVTEKTCEQRIASHQADREVALQELFYAINSDGGTVDGEELTSDEAQDRLYELPLGISRKIHVRIELSTGGPADWLEVICDKGTYGLEVEGVFYHFADWFDHAERSVDENSPLWQYAEQLVETLDAG